MLSGPEDFSHSRSRGNGCRMNGVLAWNVLSGSSERIRAAEEPRLRPAICVRPAAGPGLVATQHQDLFTL